MNLNFPHKTSTYFNFFEHIRIEDLLDNKIIVGPVSLQNFRTYLEKREFNHFNLDFYEDYVKYLKVHEEFMDKQRKLFTNQSGKQAGPSQRVLSTVDLLRTKFNRSISFQDSSNNLSSVVWQGGSSTLRSTNGPSSKLVDTSNAHFLTLPIKISSESMSRSHQFNIKSDTSRNGSQKMISDIKGSGNIIKSRDGRVSSLHAIVEASEHDSDSDAKDKRLNKLRPTTAPVKSSNLKSNVISLEDFSERFGGTYKRLVAPIHIDPNARILIGHLYTILNTYIVEGSPKQISLDEKERNELLNQVVEFKADHPSIFQASVAHCLSAMRHQSFPNFMKECYGLMCQELVFFSVYINESEDQSVENGGKQLGVFTSNDWIGMGRSLNELLKLFAVQEENRRGIDKEVSKAWKMKFNLFSRKSTNEKVPKISEDRNATIQGSSVFGD